MNFMTALDIASSGMGAMRTHLNIISMNLANANTTETPEGGPYKRKSVIFETSQVFSPTDPKMMDPMNREIKGVRAAGMAVDSRPNRMVYDPHHPSANKEGYVAFPDINVVEEMANMITAMRSYEANVNTATSVKTMFRRALMIGQG